MPTTPEQVTTERQQGACHVIDLLATAALCLFVLLASWWGLDWIEVHRQAARERLASDVRARRRMRAVVAMSERRL